MKIRIDKSEKTPIYAQIHSKIRSMIFEGYIGDGYSLPSERILARELGVHRNTVTRAYSELKSEGLISAVHGKGYRVNFLKEADSSQKRKDVRWDAIIRKEYEDFECDFDDLYSKSFDKNLISFAGGVAARELYPSSEMADVFEKILNDERDRAYFYTPFRGDPELCREIVGFLRDKGISARANNIQIFAENNQALDFILGLMLSKGDRVIIDETMSADVYRTIQLAGGEVISVPGDDEGMICDNLDTIIQKYSPKFIYVDSSFNNPKGTVLSLERREKLLEMSYKYRIPIIEEDEGSELYYERGPITSLKAMDRGNNVIYMYSFSLTMLPGIGVSFVVADATLVEQLERMVSLRIANPDWAAQMVMLEYMKKGIFQGRLEDFRRTCRKKRDLMCQRMDELVARYGLEYRKPEGGVYLWVKLPSRINARNLLRESQKRGMTFMPGYLFYSTKSMGKNYFRLNYSYPTVQEIQGGMDILEASIERLMAQ